MPTILRDPVVSYHLLDLVKDRQTFLEFVEALAQEVARERRWRESDRPETDEPPDRSLETFLRKALSWARDPRWRDFTIYQEASWRNFAYLLFNAKHYHKW
jgi:hypothetical protein